jgi:hypothetical protein
MKPTDLADCIALINLVLQPVAVAEILWKKRISIPNTEMQILSTKDPSLTYLQLDWIHMQNDIGSTCPSRFKFLF